ncbi:hypothetical protein ACSYAD_28790 [Acaryochloris marina NIES-2412]|uniref:hypothetical protein n=1 Tax=Acaryochloris marina TaxID=155978 RepID=UPI0040582200
MDGLLAENEKAIKQRIVDLKLKDKEISQLEKLQRIKRTEKEIKREGTWFKIAFIGIGILIGVPVGGFLNHLAGQNAAVSSPVEQVSGK